MNTRGSVVVLPLVPHPHYFKKNSPFCSSCVIFVIFSRIYSYRGSVCFFAAVKYPVPVDAGVKPFRGWGYPPNPLLWGSLYMCIFLLASDDAKTCTPKPALIHWKSAGFPVYVFTSGKARLPKTHPLRVACPLPMPFRHTRAFW